MGLWACPHNTDSSLYTSAYPFSPPSHPCNVYVVQMSIKLWSFCVYLAQKKRNTQKCSNFLKWQGISDVIFKTVQQISPNCICAVWRLLAKSEAGHIWTGRQPVAGQEKTNKKHFCVRHKREDRRSDSFQREVVISK